MRLWFGSASKTVCSLLAALLAAVSTAATEEVPQRRAFFGDLHIHTGLSLDAFAWSVRVTPDDAYRFAKGEPIRLRDGGAVQLRGPRLDFLAVTDHAEYLGIPAALADPSSPIFEHADKPQVFPFASFMDLVERLERLHYDGSSLMTSGAVADAWYRIVDAAQRHNSPGEFTAFVGYEFTGLRHRNVIFKDGDRIPLPFSSVDSNRPEDLWLWLDQQREAGVAALAIPHMSSGILELGWHRTDGGHLTKALAEQRQRHEPLLEIYQQKGSSAAHPLLSPTDEWANFAIRANFDPRVAVGTYWRTLLGRGMAFEEWLDVNPYRLGAAGASDSHFRGGDFYDEKRHTFAGKPTERGVAHPRELGGWEGFRTPLRASGGSGGLTGIWAEANTRGALFDAMRRRETFATSGPRIAVRLFGGFGLAARLADVVDVDDDAAAYRHGVPMGGTLSAADRPGEEPPSFVAWALRDPQSGRLERLQIVKGELESAGSWWLYAIAHAIPDRLQRLVPLRQYRRSGGARTQERVFDVACSDGRRPHPHSHRCPDNGAGVDLADCSVAPGLGAEALRAFWRDPDFNPNRRSYYYLRVLENPSCRWSTWESLRHGVSPNPDLPATIQERAWSSPIWYSP